MKKILSIILFTFSVLNLLGQNILPTAKANDKSFPININEKNFKKLKKFEGGVIAFNGIIKKSEISRNNTPFYKLKISDNNYLWTVLMFKNETNKIGDTTRVVGYLRPTPTESNENENKYLDGRYMVIAFGLVDLKNSNF